MLYKEKKEPSPEALNLFIEGSKRENETLLTEKNFLTLTTFLIFALRCVGSA